MFEDGLSYPFRGKWPKRTLIGGLLYVFAGVLLLPVFPVVGYLIDVLKTTVAGEEEPPAFDDWGDLFVTGLVGTLIMIVYSVVPFAVYGGSFALLSVAVDGQGGDVLAGLGSVMALLVIPVVLFFYYILPAALTNYAIKERFGAAFEFGSLKPVLLSGEYLTAVFLVLVVTVLLGIATIIVSFTIIGLLFVPFLQFIEWVAVFRMFGTAFQSVASNAPKTASTTGVSPN